MLMKNNKKPYDEIELTVQNKNVKKGKDLFQKLIQNTEKSNYKSWFKARYRYANFLIKFAKEKPKFIEEAIEILSFVLKNLSQDDNRTDWGMINIALGFAYNRRKSGDPETNIDNEIRYYEAALQTFNFNEKPERWAAAKAGVGYAYGRKRKGIKSENINKAMINIMDSLDYYTKNSFPDDYWDKMKELSRLKKLLGNDKLWNDMWEQYELS